MIRRLIVALGILGLSLGGLSAQDVGQNLLADPGFEGTAMNVVDQDQGEGVTFAVNVGWSGWYATSPRTQDWQNRIPNGTGRNNAGLGFVRSGNRSMELSRGFATFTAAVYQTVDVTPGTVLRGSAYYVMDLSEGAASQARVGIDPNGGANPYDSDVVWSDWGGNQLASAGFRELSVVATAQGPRVTLFLFTTQRFPSQQNGIFWDDAALTVLQPGTGQPPPADDPDPDPPPQNPDPQPTSPPPTQVVVTPQAPNPDGSIIHQVARGETLSSIARAYGRTLEEVLALNPELGDGQLIRVGQLIVIEPRPGATPPGATLESPATFTPMPTDDPGTTEVAVADPQTASVCMQLYEDRNANGLRDPSEPPLGGGSLRLDAEDGTQVGSTMTDGGADPVCFDGLPPGMYMARGEPPAGYGLPSGSVRRLDLSSGGTLTLAFGAVQGADLALPTPPPETTLVEVEDGGTNQALQNIGLLIFGLAGVTLVIGLGITFMLRRRYMLLLIVATIGLSPLQAQTDGGSFCVRGFEDLNADGTRNPDESLLQRNFAANLQDADGVVIASRTIEDSDRRSTGVVCFDDLPAGQYGVVVTSAVYRPTGPDSMLASITPDGMPVVLEYGAQRIDSGIDPALVADDADTTPQFERLMIAFIGGLAAAVGVAALGIVLYVLVMRPRRPVTPEPDPEARFRPPDPYDDYQEYR